MNESIRLPDNDLGCQTTYVSSAWILDTTSPFCRDKEALLRMLELVTRRRRVRVGVMWHHLAARTATRSGQRCFVCSDGGPRLAGPVSLEGGHVLQVMGCLLCVALGCCIMCISSVVYIMNML